MRLFLDTNLLIDYFARRQPFFSAWVQLRCAQVLGDVELWVSAKSFTDVFYVVSRLCEGDRLQAALLESLSFLNVCPIDGDDIANAARICWPDFEDCLVDIAARKVGADCIITRDRAGFERSRLPVYSPDAFFGWLREERHVEYEAFDIDGTLWKCGITTSEVQ